jgi:hypothetical protein
MAKDKTISQIMDIVDGYEAAIRNHPPEISQEYFRGLQPYLDGVAQQSTAPRYVELGLSQEDVIALNRLIFCSSFISGWYHLNRDKEMRNKATNSCIAMVSSLGLEPEVLMPAYVEMEQHWRRTLRSKGVGKQPMAIIAAGAAIIAIIVWAILNAVN